MFKTNDTAWLHIHKDDANLMQIIYQIISSCFEDDCADKAENVRSAGFSVLHPLNKIIDLKDKPDGRAAAFRISANPNPIILYTQDNLIALALSMEFQYRLVVSPVFDRVDNKLVQNKA